LLILLLTVKAVYAQSNTGQPTCINQSEKAFTRIGVISQFKGGHQNWFDFANQHFDFKTVSNLISDSVEVFQDSVVLKFVVTRTGKLCDVTFLRGNRLLSTAATYLMLQSPDWTPGNADGRNVNTYRTLRLDIKIDKHKGTAEVRKIFDSYFKENDR
jgi:hypothetical protein